MVRQKLLANSVAASLTVTLSSVVVVIAILCLYHSTELMPTTRLEMPVPLNVDRKDLLKDSTYDFGYFSSDPSTRAFSEISRALSNTAENHTTFSDVAGSVKSQNASLKSGEPIKEVSVFDRVSHFLSAYCFINHDHLLCF